MCRHDISGNLRLHYRVIEGLLLTALEEWPMEFWEVRQFFKSLGGKETIEMLLSSDGGLKICSHATRVSMALGSQIKVKSAECGRWFVSSIFWLGMAVQISSCFDFLQEIPALVLLSDLSGYLSLLLPDVSLHTIQWCMFLYTFIYVYSFYMYDMYSKQDNINKNMTHDTLISADFDSPQKPVKPQFSGRRRLK